MRLLIVSHEFPPDKGGAGSVAYDIATNMQRRGHDVTVVTRFKAQPHESCPFRIEYVKSPPKIFSIYYWKVLKKLDVRSFDAIILNDLGASQVAAFFFPDELLGKSIIFLHGNEPESICGSAYFRLFYNHFYKKLLSRCCSMVAVSEYMKTKFINMTRLVSLESRIHVVKNGVDTELFYPDKIDLHLEYSVPKHKSLLLTVARLALGKGYCEMIDIYARLNAHSQAFHWFIIGDGPDKKKIIEYIRDSGQQDSITVIFNMDRSRLRNFYSSVEVLWLLSNYEESFGLVYLEANACGIPVIGRDIGGVGEAIQHQTSGFLITSNDDCFDLILSKKYKDISVDAALRNAQHNNISSSVDTLCQVLSKPCSTITR